MDPLDIYYNIDMLRYLSILSHRLKRRLQSRRRQMEGHLEKAPVFGQCAHHRSNRRWCVWDVRTPALYEALVCLGCAHTSAMTSAGVGSAGGVCVFRNATRTRWGCDLGHLSRHLKAYCVAVFGRTATLPWSGRRVARRVLRCMEGKPSVANRFWASGVFRSFLAQSNW